jgi:hypothetical protein
MKSRVRETRLNVGVEDRWANGTSASVAESDAAMRRKTAWMMILAMGLAGAMASPAMPQKNAKPPKPAPPTAEQEWPAIEGTWHAVAVLEAETSATGAAGGVPWPSWRDHGKDRALAASLCSA